MARLTLHIRSRDDDAWLYSPTVEGAWSTRAGLLEITRSVLAALEGQCVDDDLIVTLDDGTPVWGGDRWRDYAVCPSCGPTWNVGTLVECNVCGAPWVGGER